MVLQTYASSEGANSLTLSDLVGDWECQQAAMAHPEADSILLGSLPISTFTKTVGEDGYVVVEGKMDEVDFGMGGAYRLEYQYEINDHSIKAQIVDAKYDDLVVGDRVLSLDETLKFESNVLNSQPSTYVIREFALNSFILTERFYITVCKRRGIG